MCLTKDCPYMSECIRAVWDKKVSGMLRRSRAKAAAEKSTSKSGKTSKGAGSRR